MDELEQNKDVVSDDTKNNTLDRDNNYYFDVDSDDEFDVVRSVN